MKYKILKLDKFIGKTLQEVKDFLEKTYPNQLATEEDLKNLGEELEDTAVWYYGFGSNVRNSGGDWCVPYANWNGSDWYRFANRLSYSWDSTDRVVLLEISDDYCKCKGYKVCGGGLFNNIIKIEMEIKEKTYKIEIVCENCGSSEIIELPFGLSASGYHTCSYCGNRSSKRVCVNPDKKF